MKPKILVLANQKSENYLLATEMCGGIAVHKYLPDFDTSFDGLILCGGNDIFPQYYGQTTNGAHSFDLERDRTELELTKRFIDTGRPILGICRGHQLLNVALGGTLIQDLPCSDFHRTKNGADSVHYINAKGVLQKLYGNELYVNSAHHQAIDTLGAGLSTTAWCDGIIEAIEHKSKPYLGVQFHPERMCLTNTRNDTADGIKIFEYFINLCKKGSV